MNQGIEKSEVDSLEEAIVRANARLVEMGALSLASNAQLQEQFRQDNVSRPVLVTLSANVIRLCSQQWHLQKMQPVIAYVPNVFYITKPWLDTEVEISRKSGYTTYFLLSAEEPRKLIHSHYGGYGQRAYLANMENVFTPPSNLKVNTTPEIFLKKVALFFAK
jgi:hypothetical protein